MDIDYFNADACLLISIILFIGSFVHIWCYILEELPPILAIVNLKVAFIFLVAGCVSGILGYAYKSGWIPCKHGNRCSPLTIIEYIIVLLFFGIPIGLSCLVSVIRM